MKFEVKGIVRVNGNVQTFTKIVDAKSKNHAEEVVCAKIGSNYAVHRRSIQIESLKEVKK